MNENISLTQKKSSEVESFMRPFQGTIISTTDLTKHEKLIEIAPDHTSLNHQPGQFVEVSILGVGEAPISVSSSPLRGPHFQICVRNVGAVTSALHQLKPSDPIWIRGPYGHGFPVEQMLGKDILVVAGGIGLAPLRSLIQTIFDRRKEFGKFTLLYGTKCPDDILFQEELQSWSKELNSEVLITVDRANQQWGGNVGVVTVLFNRIEINPDQTVAVIVGPPVMFKFVLLELMARKIPSNQIFVSLERRMKCGIGKCGHCQIEQFYSCKEGPVFSYAEIENCAEAFNWKRGV